MTELMTPYGETLNKEHPLGEHPNPLLQRDLYLSLNGPWDFALDKNEARPETYHKEIIVPFSVETPLSGVAQPVSKDDYLHYRRRFHLNDEFLQGFCLLHFSAVDQIADVYLNGDHLIHHEGGYLPFSCLIEHPQPENILEVLVKDDTLSPIFARGKQAEKSGGIWYTPTSGIWQSVWLEAVPSSGYVHSLTIDPLFDEKRIKIKRDDGHSAGQGSVECRYKGELVARADFDENGLATLDLSYSFYPWTPEEPNLYDLIVYSGEDTVRSYCALRKFSNCIKGDEHFFALNDKPIFLSGLLDQGYYPDGGLTAPSEEAMKDDILLAKKCGYNCLRKHIKIEPLRWYYLCDKLGMIVLQDFVSGGSPYHNFLIVTRPLLKYGIDDTTYRYLGRALKESREQFVRDLEKTVSHLYNVPSIGQWTLFNEGWGQFDALALSKRLKGLDHSRTIDATSGWYDKGCGDYSSHHVYFVKPRLHNDHKRILSLSECGGYSLPVEGHRFSTKNFGYARFSDYPSLNEAVEKLYLKQVLPLISKEGLGECIFTQLSDVECETNGLITYDRKIQKVDIDMLKRINGDLYEAFAIHLKGLKP